MTCLATSWTTTGRNVNVGGVRRSSLDIRDRARAAAGFAGSGFTLKDLEAGLEVISWPDLRRLCDDLGFAYTEVELVKDWWTAGPRRAHSDQRRGRLLEAAMTLGARQIRIAPDLVVEAQTPPPQEFDLDLWAAELHSLAAQAHSAGTRVALEVLPMSNIAAFSDAARLVKVTDHTCAGLWVDIWHLERGPSTLEELRQISGEQVFCVELNDANQEQIGTLAFDTTHHRELCGEGDSTSRALFGPCDSWVSTGRGE